MKALVRKREKLVKQSASASRREDYEQLHATSTGATLTFTTKPVIRMIIEKRSRLSRGLLHVQGSSWETPAVVKRTAHKRVGVA